MLVAALILAAGAYGLSALLSSSGQGTKSAQASPAGGRPASPTIPSYPTNPANPSNPGNPANPTIPSNPPNPSNPTNPSGTPTGLLKWLGMQIETLPPGQVVVETVAQGSAADSAGIEPGDVIVTINNKQITTTGDIRAAIRGLSRGQSVEIEISRGSTLFMTHATLTAPPSGSP